MDYQTDVSRRAKGGAHWPSLDCGARTRSASAQLISAVETTAWTVIVPLCIATVLTGRVQSLGTSWGVFRHYWVLAELVLTVPASAILLLHTRPITHLAEVATTGPLGSAGDRRIRIQLNANAAAALVMLLVTTVLSIYKPRGLTPCGQRMPPQEPA